jgi:hypothetical protein
VLGGSVHEMRSDGEHDSDEAEDLEDAIPYSEDFDDWPDAPVMLCPDPAAAHQVMESRTACCAVAVCIEGGRLRARADGVTHLEAEQLLRVQLTACKQRFPHDLGALWQCVVVPHCSDPLAVPACWPPLTHTGV